MSKHTKGPWSRNPCTKDEGAGNSFDVYGPNVEDSGVPFLFCIEPWSVKEDDCAILLAAPDMYEALKELMRLHPNMCHMCKEWDTGDGCSLSEYSHDSDPAGNQEACPDFIMTDWFKGIVGKAQSILSQIGGEG